MSPNGPTRFQPNSLNPKSPTTCQRCFLTLAVLCTMSVWPTLALSQITSANLFYTGADISLEALPNMPSANLPNNNTTFKDNGVVKPVDQILYDHGANLFRLRIFVNPEAAYTNTNVGAIQSQAYDIAMAQQIKADAPGAKFILDFHYSDTWADPGHQTISGLWTDHSLSALEADVQSYTQTTLQAFKSADVMPDIVQLGNETTNGILWPTGQLNFTNAGWAAYGGLLNAGIAGVRAVQGTGPRIPIALSIDKGDKDGQPQYHYGTIQKPVVINGPAGTGGGGVTDFDIEGVDFYPTSSDLLSTMTSNLTTLANTNYSTFTAPGNTLPLKKIMVLETNSPWKSINNVGDSNQFAKTPAGQEAEFLGVRNMLLNLPHGDGLGLLYWYPEAVQVNPYSIYNGGATALFDANTSGHNALQTITNNDFLVVGPGDFTADGHLSIADVQAMMMALSDPADFKATHNFTDADLLNIGDLNGDHVFNNADLQALLSMMANNAAAGGAATFAAVPEPESYQLLLIGLALVGILYSLRISGSASATP